MSDPAWPLIANFRDVGGHPGTDGRAVKRGLIFRGSSLADATDDDLARLGSLGVGLVFDLRCRQEADGSPDRLPSGARYRRESGVMSADEGAGDDFEWLDWARLMDQLEASDEALLAMETFQGGTYTEMIRRPASFSALANELLDASGRGVYIHCAAGKDRTGVACAVVQRLLGVGWDDILADYMESANHPRADVSWVRELASRHSSRVEALVNTMLGVTPQQLETSFHEIDNAWGDWEGFVQDGLGLGDEDVATLWAAYLEP